jgi:hypothetical protein
VFDSERLPSALSATADGEFVAGNGLRFRLPNSGDLVAVAPHCEDASSAALKLLQRCCLNAPDTQQWTDALLAEVEARMAALEAATDIELQFECAACGHNWADHFDIGAYFWEELDREAQHVLDDVHQLALLYGWDEHRILAMSGARRAAYLERCTA